MVKNFTSVDICCRSSHVSLKTRGTCALRRVVTKVSLYFIDMSNFIQRVLLTDENKTKNSFRF
jgi:hypothetical protein